jgi:nucleoside-diphosphate-sugar epimerase
MRVLVTGATGFVGSHLIPALVADGHDVFAAVRSAERLEAGPGITPVECDLAGQVEARSLPEVEAIVHLAQANVRFPDGAAELYRVNTASTQALLDHGRRVGASRFVLTSSGSVYGFGPRPFAESDPVSPHDFYALTKIHSEQLVAAYRDEFATTSVLRLFAPYGPGQTGRLIPSLAQRVRQGNAVTLNGGGQPRMNPIYIDDLVAVLLASLGRDGHETVNVGGDEAVGVGEIAAVLAGAIGTEARFEEGEPEGPGDLVGDTTLLHELYAPASLVPLEEGLRRTVDSLAAEEVSA